MENFPKTKKRGRPRKIPESELERELREAQHKFRTLPKVMQGQYSFDVPTERTAANRFYAARAYEVLLELSERVPAQFPDNPVLAAKIRVGIDWILGRTTVLSELGRMMAEDPSQGDIARFQRTVWHIAERHSKFTAREAAAYVRRMRLGEASAGRRGRLRALHHDLNAAINYHRRRFPESSWADVLKALELTEEQIRKKIR